MDTEYSKRVYQGVRVKHTVKDLLAEKRSRQTSGPRYSEQRWAEDRQFANRYGGATTPPSFVQMPGSHMLPGYYGMRRPYLSDSDFCSSTKQFPSDVYPSSLGGKSLGCDPSAMGGYPSLIDSYYPETFGDYRSAAFTSGGGSIFPSSALSSLLPPFTGESSHLFLRESWEQSVPDPVSQVDGICPDSLASVSIPPSMVSPEPPGSPSQYRSPSRGSALGPTSTSQPYTTLHSLEDSHYHALTTSSYPALPSSFSCPPYMSSTSTDASLSKMAPLGTEEADSSLPPHGETQSSWVKVDGSSWSPYEIRRSY